MIGLGLGLGLGGQPVSGGGSGPYTPASEAGNNLWIVPDAAHSFTDAGTTHVSVSGTDTVQQINDQSAAARNLSQATAGSRPIWNSGSGKPYLLFDHVDDVLGTATNAAWTDGSGQFWAALSIGTGTVNETYAAIYGGISTNELLRTNIFNASDNSTNAQVYDSAGGATTTPSSGSVTGDVTMIITATTTLLSVYKNGVLVTSVSLTGTRNSASAKFFLGAIQGASNFWGGKIYGAAAGSGLLSSVANMHTYMAGLHP